AAEAALRAAQLDPDSEQYWTVVMDVYRKTGNIKAMPSVLDELIRLNPEKVDYYHEKAYALFLDKKYEAALATCDTITARFGNIEEQQDRKSTRLNSSHVKISYAVFCLK